MTFQSLKYRPIKHVYIRANKGDYYIKKYYMLNIHKKIKLQKFGKKNGQTQLKIINEGKQTTEKDEKKKMTSRYAKLL